MDGGLAAFCLAEAALAFLAVWCWTRRSGPSRHVRKSRPAAWNPFGKGQRRAALRQECLDELPALLDILSLGLSAGLSFDASLELYCSRMENGLAAELRGALFSWRCGMANRQEALESLGSELGLPAFQRFASAVTESLGFGSPLADALESQSRLLREEERLRVEERIEKVPVKMLIPLGTLVVPAMLLAILGPLLGASATFA